MQTVKFYVIVSIIQLWQITAILMSVDPRQLVVSLALTERNTSM